MNRISTILWGAFLIMVTIASVPLSSQAPEPRPLSWKLECAGGDCPLLRGVPQTAGMRSGFVRLKPGDAVGWHTTGKNEESLVILHGNGEARLRSVRPSL